MENRLPVPSSGMISWGVAGLEVWTCPGGPPRWQTLVSPCLASPVTFKMWSSSSKRSLCTRVGSAPALQQCRGFSAVLGITGGGIVIISIIIIKIIIIFHGHGKVLLEMGSEIPSWVALSCRVLSSLEALLLMGCEQGMKLGWRSWMGFFGSHGKIPLSRGWAAHTHHQLHLPADRVSQSQDCFPAWSLSP